MKATGEETKGAATGPQATASRGDRLESAPDGDERSRPAGADHDHVEQSSVEQAWAEALQRRDGLRQRTGVLGQIVRERGQDTRDLVGEPGPARAARGRFRASLAGPGLSLIAEVKRASPSQGAIAALDPAQAARSYEQGGAAALSVLTEPRHFGGNREALLEVVAACALPALRKDFVVHPAMLQEAANWGASAALLMVSVLGEQTALYLRLARHLGLDALVEVHDEAELEVALEAGADIIGVNNRDLTTLEISLANAPRLGRLARSQGFGGLLVAESGYRVAGDLAGLHGLADAVLVGSSLAASRDLAQAVRELLA